MARAHDLHNVNFLKFQMGFRETARIRVELFSFRSRFTVGRILEHVERHCSKET